MKIFNVMSIYILYFAYESCAHVQLKDFYCCDIFTQNDDGKQNNYCEISLKIGKYLIKLN